MEVWKLEIWRTVVGRFLCSSQNAIYIYIYSFHVRFYYCYIRRHIHISIWAEHAEKMPNFWPISKWERKWIVHESEQNASHRVPTHPTAATVVVVVIAVIAVVVFGIFVFHVLVSVYFKMKHTAAVATTTWTKIVRMEKTYNIYIHKHIRAQYVVCILHAETCSFVRMPLCWWKW